MMLTYTLPAYIVYTTTFCLITQEVLCPPLTHASKYIYNNTYVFVTFIIVKLPMPAADIRISGARSRMDMLPDYFEAAATSKN